MRPEINNEIIEKSLIYVFKGDRISAGVCREVFDCKVDSSLVIKIEKYARDFQNVLEWNIWQQVKGTDFEKYFAPCIDISADGSILLQKKCDKPHIKDFPEELPAFMNQDTKYQNFGLYEGRLVMIDYGNWRITDNVETELIKVQWWNDDAKH